MLFFRAAFCAALFTFLLGPIARAQDVSLTSLDGSVQLEGTLLGFDGEFYRLSTVYGEMTVDGSGVRCTGPGCPNLSDFVAELRISGSATLGAVLVPALLENFAARTSHQIKRIVTDDTHTTYVMAHRNAPDKPIANFHIRTTTTDEGFADLLADEADVVMSLREIRQSEATRAREAGLGELTEANRSRVVALDAMVAVVSPGNPVQTISLATLADIFAGRITNWARLGGPDAPISLYLPAEGTGLSQTIEDRLMVPARLKLSPKAEHLSTARDVSARVVRDRLGIGITSFSETGNARALPLRGSCGFSLRAWRRTIKTEDYPLTAPMFLYLPARRLPRIARDFLRFTRSHNAQIVIRRAGFVDQAPEEVALDTQGDRLTNAILVAQDNKGLPGLQAMTKALKGHKRLTTSFRFETGSIRLDAQSRSNVQQLARSLEAGTYDNRQLLFVGFSDGAGGAAANLEIAERRAAAVRAAVLKAAETMDQTRVDIQTLAYGEAMPMACDDTEWGRQVNRRVEVWVR